MANNSTIMIRIALAAILLVAVCADAFAGVDVLKAKLQHRFPVLGSNYGAAAAGAAASGRGYGGYGGGSAASSAAAAGGSGGYPGYYGGPGSAASAAAAAGSGRTYGRPVRPTYVHGFNDEPYGEEEPFQPRHRLGSFGSGYHGSSAASAAAASANNVAALNAPVAPLKPLRHLDSYRRHNLAYPRTRYYSPVHGGGAASASSSAAGGGYGGFGGAAASSAAAAASHGAGYADEPIEFDQGLGVGAATRVASAAAGTYSNDDNGREKSSYKRRTENVHNHEDGHADDNHYYNAQSYGKTDDENMHEAYNKNNEDVEQTPHVYRSKKSGENYVMDYNKARRESGSGVLASDKHSSGFNKNSRRFIENVDQKHKIEGGGVVEHIDRVSAQNLDDADEEIYDSDGLHGSAAASSAAAAANGVL